jgi:predicted ferric reductase
MIIWDVLRAAGIGAFVMLFLSVSWGLVATTQALGKRVAKPTAIAVHQFLSTVGLLLLAVHVGGLLLDTYTPFHVLDVLVPLHASYRTAGVAFGVVGMYAMVIVLVSSWMRKRIGTAWWRRLHALAAPAYVLALLHGVFAGTDASRTWMYVMYVGSAALVLFLLLARALTVGLRKERRPHPVRAADELASRRAAAAG